MKTSNRRCIKNTLVLVNKKYILGIWEQNLLKVSSTHLFQFSYYWIISIEALMYEQNLNVAFGGSAKAVGHSDQ